VKPLDDLVEHISAMATKLRVKKDFNPDLHFLAIDGPDQTAVDSVLHPSSDARPGKPGEC
jgi:hypothetical protein